MKSGDFNFSSMPQILAQFASFARSSVAGVSWVSPLGSPKALEIDMYTLPEAAGMGQYKKWEWQTSVEVQVEHTQATREFGHRTFEP